MKIFMLSIKLFIYGFFCDMCIKVCTGITERNLIRKRPLNNRLLAFISNLSSNSLCKWQIIEKRFIALSVEKYFS